MAGVINNSNAPYSKSKKIIVKFYPYALIFLLLLSSVIFTILGKYWNDTFYGGSAKSAYDSIIEEYSADFLPLKKAMSGIHDMAYKKPDGALVAAMNTYPADATEDKTPGVLLHEWKQLIDLNPALSAASARNMDGENPVSVSAPPAFTTVSDEYFEDACFIGDSRTVGISQYAGINAAAFLCKTSLSIYDFDKPKITYNNEKTSVKEVLENESFSKIYLMVGINECGRGTPESFYEYYKEVIGQIRALQPEALIFIEGNLYVTKEKSDNNASINNENISVRNSLISGLANHKDIFYIDINESPLCEGGSLLPAYTWDQVHIKAQYYDIWKEFLMSHAIVT